MPYLSIQTNINVGPDLHTTLLTKASQLIAEILGKPEDYVMVALQANTPMRFAGTDQATAFLALKSIRLPKAATTELSQKICAFIEENLRVPKNRIYIEFTNAEAALWGWDGRTF